MEIIDELEATKRGPYAGCVGYFSANGQMDTCIVLRTALIKDGVLHVQAGVMSCTTWFPRTSSRRHHQQGQGGRARRRGSGGSAARSARAATAEGNGGPFA